MHWRRAVVLVPTYIDIVYSSYAYSFAYLFVPYVGLSMMLDSMSQMIWMLFNDCG